MNRKRFNKNYDEINRIARVKMHKSGKSWVRTVMSQLSLLRVMKSGGSDVSERVVVQDCQTTENLEKSRHAYLKGLLAAGSLTGGTALTQQIVEAAETTDQVGETATLAGNDIVLVTVEEQTVVVDESASLSTSSSHSASESASESLELSESASIADSLKFSESQAFSESIQLSESVSLSTIYGIGISLCFS